MSHLSIVSPCILRLWLLLNSSSLTPVCLQCLPCIAIVGYWIAPAHSSLSSVPSVYGTEQLQPLFNVSYVLLQSGYWIAPFFAVVCLLNSSNLTPASVPWLRYITGYWLAPISLRLSLVTPVYC
jgi:hypothetical protein